MLHGELGRFPMDIAMKVRMINFLTKIIFGKEDKLFFFYYIRFLTS